MTASATEPMEPLPTTPVMSTSVPPAAAAARVTVGTLVAGAFEVWRRNLASFAAVALIAHALSLAMLWAAGAPFLRQQARLGSVTPEGQAFVQSGRYWAIVGASLLLTIWAAGALSAGALDHLGGRRVAFGEMVRRTFRRSFALATSSVLSLLAFVVGLVLLVVPGVLLLLMYALTVPVAVAERLSPLGILRRSRALTKGHRAKVFALLLILYIAAYAPTYAVGLLAGDVPYLATALNLLVNGLLGPLYLVAPAVAYHQLRVAAEGAGTAALERVFE